MTKFDGKLMIAFGKFMRTINSKCVKYNDFFIRNVMVDIACEMEMNDIEYDIFYSKCDEFVNTIGGNNDI